MLLAAIHCTMLIGVVVHMTTSLPLNPIHSDIGEGRVVRETMGLPGGDSFTEVMAVESEYNRYGERTRVRSSLGADTELTYDRLGLLGGVKAEVETVERLDNTEEGNLENPNLEERKAEERNLEDLNLESRATDTGIATATTTATDTATTTTTKSWESRIERNEVGREIERFATGGIRISTDYNEMGLVSSRHVHSGERHTGWRHYRWDVGARLLSMRCSMRKEPVIYAYDEICRLIRGEYSLLESIFRTPDKVGNLYRESECKGRRYDRGGRLLWDGEYHYAYDCEGNLIHKTRRDINAETAENAHTGDTVGKKKKAGWFSLLFGSDEDNKDNSRDTYPFLDWQPGDTCYFWLANGMLGSVLTPEGKTVYFGYDALGRRVSKTVEGTVRRYGWDGNVLLHEWEISEAARPKLVTDDIGREVYNCTEKTENLVTWVYDGMSFTPVAKVTEQERYTIIHDYLGTPTQAYDSKGELVWEMVLDVYGEVNECNGDRTLVPFRYQGQYEDEETGLYYNRFRYYSPQMGMYISQDPIGLEGNNPTLYGYVEDTNIWLDVWGLMKGQYNGPKPKYTNDGHHELGNPKFRGGGDKTSIIPRNAETIYEYAIPDNKGKHWYAIDESGEIHRFGNSNNGTVHWNGSSRQRRGLVVPPEVQSRFNKPNAHRKAPKAIYCCKKN